MANKLKNAEGLAHLDLDELAWINSNPPQRAPLEHSHSKILEFIESNESWVIEGCYSDLLELVSSQANEAIFLNLPVEMCVENAKNRPWEPNKYPSKEEQDANLDMLLDWIRDYESRDDVFSMASHMKFFDSFAGSKSMVTSNG